MQELSLQLYSIQSEIQQNGFEKTLQAVAEMGYTGVEFAGFGDVPKEKMKQYLEQAGLKAISAHASDICGKEEEYMEYLSYLGAKHIVCPYASLETLSAVKQKAEEFNKTGRILKENGFYFGYHNHAGEFWLTFGGKCVWDLLFELTDPNYVYAQMDTFHVFRADADVYAQIEKYKNRMPTMHLKEITSAADKEDTYAGNGVIDFKRILQMTQECGMEYIYEYEGKNAMESCKKAAAYLKQL